MRFLLKILLLFFLFSGLQLNSQLSKKHYIPPLTSASGQSTAPGDQWLYISTPSVDPINFTVKRADGTIFRTGQVSNANSQEFSAGPTGSSGYLFIPRSGAELAQDSAGFIIEAEQEIYVSARFNSGEAFGGRQYHGGALVSKGESALGTKFRLGALQIKANGHLNFGSIMATEDNTVINITLPTGNGQQLFSGATSSNIILNAGQTYVFGSENRQDSSYGIIGTLVESDKPIVVNSGSGLGSFAEGEGGQDYGVDQIVGSDKVGSEYIFVRGGGEDSWENVLLIADQDNTSVKVNGQNYVTLNEGDFTIIEGDKYASNGTMYVSTENKSDKIFAYQGLGDVWNQDNSRAARQGMFFVPPLNCSSKGNVDNIAKINRVGKNFEDGVVTVVTKDNAKVEVNGSDIMNQPGGVTTTGPLSVTGNADYEVYIVKGLTGDVKVTGDDELYVAYYNYNDAATTGGFYSGFVTPPKFEADIDFETLGSCIRKDGDSNIVLRALDVSNFTSIVWEVEDNLGNFISTGIDSNEYTPTQAGTYRLKGILDCSESSFYSAEITVSVCADDYDKDGIIDNIDLDLDNDGISNAFESRGSGVFNFTDLTNPTLFLEKESTSLTGLATLEQIEVTPGTYNLTGTPDRLTTEVSPGTDGEFRVNLNFNENLNILLVDSDSQIQAVDGEIFEIKASSVESNITLLDPDKNLLIDIGNNVFRDINEPYTSNTIKFKFKSRTGNTFEFHASNIEGLIITHFLNNISSTTSSFFTPQIKVSAYNLNTDGTDDDDMFDLDSDNDGCNDVIEAGYLDPDNDGVYGEGIPNFDDETVNARGQIIDDGYDADAEPNKDNAGVYYFQKLAEAPVISTQPQSTIACQVGANVEFTVSITTNDTPVFQWQKFDSTNSLWINIDENDTYEGVTTTTLKVNNVDLSMNGDKFRVNVSTDEYACLVDSNDDVTLQVEEALPIANIVDDIILCDDDSVGNDSDGFIANFDLSSKINAILGEAQSTEDFTVTFHSSLDDLSDLNSNGFTSPFTNTVSGGQEIFVRVLNNDSQCYNGATSFNVVVAELPTIINPIVTIEQCDSDEDNNGKTKFNLTEYNNLISENFESETFEYYLDEQLTQIIDNPTDFENQTLFNQSVYVKIITDQDCYRESRIDLKIGASLIDENFMENYSKCETSPVDAQDGIEVWGSEIFSEINTKLIASDSKFSEQNISVSYYSSEDDALTKKNQIDFESAGFSYSNITANVQGIWALVENNDLDAVSCLGLKQVATLYVEPRPIATAVTIDRQCDGDSDLDLDSQDGIYPFDVSLIEEQVINGQTGVTVTYFNEDGSPIQNFGPVFETASQTITIKVERDPSYPNITNPDGLCYDETTLEFIVDDTPEIFPVTIQDQCDDGEDDSDGFSEFDTSNLISSLMGNQSLDDYSISFEYTDEEGNLLTSNELRNPFNTNSQTVIATITNKLNESCPAVAEIEFVVNPLPTFTVDDSTIVCLNLDPIPIGVTSAEAEYTYTWEHEDLNGNTTTFPSTEDTILIGVGGTYFVTATTTDGTNCSRTLSIDVDESIIATITLDDITVDDLTSDNNNTITIDPTNLGIGDYEYAIDDPTGPYQDEPFFEQVRPGIHTIYVRDKNDCGIAQIEVSVIGYKKFFTPNGDGIHDNWRILGIREDFQPNSRVYIFDRYGKLLKELDPVTEGWDGTYLGRPMPQTDYWFRVFLEDGREFKGHFSLVRGK